ncbi:hypothetical protein HMPREF3212_03137 [Citrobacter freundii]|nr:hypothetical protein HMPREF3212_03137 [Citrobacter freundii]
MVPVFLPAKCFPGTQIIKLILMALKIKFLSLSLQFYLLIKDIHIFQYLFNSIRV